MAEDIVVTGMRRSARAVEVIQSEIGDYKLYTVPMPTTVAARAQKQVSLMTRPGVSVRTVYVSTLAGGALQPVHPVLRMRNRKVDGLGVPLPAGQVMVFQDGGDRPILLGQTSLGDRAVDEEIELDLPATPGVSAILEHPTDAAKTPRYVLTVSNANPWPIAYEARFDPSDGGVPTAGKVITRNGRRIWAVTVPANGRATLGYSLREPG